MRNDKGQFVKGYQGLAFNKNPSWKGGKHITEEGYVKVCIGKKKYRYEHRLVMEEKLGRKLDFNETVHHKNHNRQDNRSENLEILSRSEHGRLHFLKYHHQKKFLTN